MMLPEFQKTLVRILLLGLVITSFSLHSTTLAEEVLKIGGTGTALGSMQLLIKAFEKSYPGIKVMMILPSIGSEGAIRAVSKGAIDIGLSARPIKDEERKLGLSAIEYARTPFILATKKDVNISGLSTDEIIKIYRGEKETWPGGERIRLVLRLATDTDSLLVKKISPEMSNALDATLSRQGMTIALTDQDCVDIIEKTPGGLGFTTLTQIVSEKRPLKILSFNGATPSTKTLANGSYPLFKSLYMVTKTEPSVLVQKFIDFVRSPGGRKILEESGNVPMIGKPGK
jgi:phosphate transport system substrate-binding protein